MFVDFQVEYNILTTIRHVVDRGARNHGGRKVNGAGLKLGWNSLLYRTE
jgi:hypothetical protein